MARACAGHHGVRAGRVHDSGRRNGDGGDCRYGNGRALRRRLAHRTSPLCGQQLVSRRNAVVTGAVASVLDVLAVRPDRIAVLKDVPLHNGSWLVEMPGGQRAVLRRYHPGASPEDLAYEYAVLDHLAATGWVVPHPVGEPVCHDGLWYCLTRHVPGEPAAGESRAQRRRRGRDLARLDLALRDLGQRIGQRPGWRPQHSAVTANADIDWQACIRQLAAVSTRLGSWAQAAAGQTRAALAAIGAGELPTTVIHGDFAEWNVHYQGGRLAGVIDFGLTRRDSRPTSSPSHAPTAPRTPPTPTAANWPAATGPSARWRKQPSGPCTTRSVSTWPPGNSITAARQASTT
jgi:hypothetical protein